MRKMHQDQLVHVHVHPPFPSFAWVMTAQANPPTPVYAYGYIENAHTLRTRLPAHRAAPPGRRRPYPRASRPSLSLSPARAVGDGKFMETVDYRYHHDLPSRPYVPWLEGYTLQERGAQQLRQRQRQIQEELLPLDLTIAAPAVTPSVSSSDNVRSKKRMTVDVVKFRRLDVALSALRRACRLSAKA